MNQIEKKQTRILFVILIPFIYPAIVFLIYISTELHEAFIKNVMDKILKNNWELLTFISEHMYYFIVIVLIWFFILGLLSNNLKNKSNQKTMLYTILASLLKVLKWNFHFALLIIELHLLILHIIIKMLEIRINKNENYFKEVGSFLHKEYIKI